MKEYRIIIAIIIVSLLLYCLTLKGAVGNFSTTVDLWKQRVDGFKPGIFEISHESSSYVTLLSMANNGSITLDKSFADIGIPDIGYYNGKLYSFFPIGLPIIAFIPYVLGCIFNLGQVSAFAIIPIIAILSEILLYKIARTVFKLSISLSMLTVLIFAFGSFSWNYSVTLYQHQVVVFLGLFMFFAIVKFKEHGQQQAWWSIALWSSYGISIFFDFPNIVLLAPFIIYFICISIDETRRLRTKSFITCIAGSVFFLTFICAHLLYSHFVYGHWWLVSNALPQSSNFSYKFLLYNAEFIARQKANLSVYFSLLHVPSGLYTFFVEPTKSFLYFSPIFLLALFGLPVIRHNEYGYLLSASVLTTIFFYASFGDSAGGWTFGLRYLVFIFPFLSLLIALGMKKMNGLGIKILGYVLLCYSSMNILSGVLTTNFSPPNLETSYYGIKNYGYIIDGLSNSFIFNTFLRSHMLLSTYYVIILGILFSLFAFVIFILPIHDKVDL
ncbi:hypothetical protein KW783_01685 [Candidatus Parcubacteria bacterium]|nr:hypothetical protein [Candidatus Parcubacteria bacterium]